MLRMMVAIFLSIGFVGTALADNISNIHKCNIEEISIKGGVFTVNCKVGRDYVVGVDFQRKPVVGFDMDLGDVFADRCFKLASLALVSESHFVMYAMETRGGGESDGSMQGVQCGIVPKLLHYHRDLPTGDDGTDNGGGTEL